MLAHMRATISRAAAQLRQRRNTWHCGVAVFLACSSSGPVATPAEPAVSVEPVPYPVDDVPVLRIAPLRPSAGSTPDAVELRRSVALDDLEARAQIINAEGELQSPCAIATAALSGPDAMNWPQDGWLRLPLDYGAPLPDGVYAELIFIGFQRAASDARLDFENDLRFFEVAEGRMHVLTPAEHEARTAPPPGPDGARPGVGEVSVERPVPRFDLCPPF